MRTERLAWLAGAVAIVTAVLLAPLALPAGWDKAAHFAVFSALTLALWRATGGAMPVFVLAAVLVLAGLDEWRQAYLPGRNSDAGDFLADFAAALTTGALLFMQRKRICAESSPR